MQWGERGEPVLNAAEDCDRSKIDGLVGDTPIPDLGSELVVAVTAVTHGDRSDYVPKILWMAYTVRCLIRKNVSMCVLRPFWCFPPSTPMDQAHTATLCTQ